MNIKKCQTIMTIALIILLIFTIALISVTNLIKSRNDYLQDNIDYLFSYNFSEAQEKLFYEQDLNLMESSVRENIYVCASLFQYTTYVENEALGQIVNILSNVEDLEHLKECIGEKGETINTLGKLILDLKNEGLAEDVLKGILPYA